MVRCLMGVLVGGWCLVSASCRKDRAVDHPATSVRVPKSKAARARQGAAQERLAAVAGGAPVRLVWVEDPSEETSDTFAEGERLHLMGWDPREGGPRRLVGAEGNFGRPLLTPDGSQVVFTEKRMQRRDGARHFKPRIRVVDWETGQVRTVGKGFAVDTWADPTTGKTWIFALDTLHPARQPSVSGSRLVRFALDAPERREDVWTRTQLSVDSVQVSRDGRKFAALFPWPDAGLGDFASGQWTKLDVGCWPGLAPDNSYLGWIFDGPHRHLRLVAPVADTRWKVALSSGPELRGKEAYHPRWSNHPQFIVFTGPYTKKKQGSRNAISSGGLSAEVHIGKLSPDLRSLESTLKLTHNKNGDFYPDLWVGGADALTVAGFPQKPAAADPAPPAWPPSPEGLVFVWRDLRAANEVPGGEGRPACHLEARGFGRFNAHLGALLDGGWFEADDDSNRALAAAVRAGRGLTIQCLLTESAAPTGASPIPWIAWRTADGSSLLALERRGQDIVISAGSGDTRVVAAHRLAPVIGQPVALALVWQGTALRLAVNGAWAGESVAVPASLASHWPEGALVLGQTTGMPIGSRPPAAAVERLTVHGRALGLEDMAERSRLDRAATRERGLPPRIRVRARVVEATEPDLGSMDTYRRLLVDHTYEVTAVLEGALEARRLAVLHWAVLDDAAVAGIPRALGAEFELTLEPHASHPELQGELTQLGSEEFELPVFLDVQTPAG